MTTKTTFALMLFLGVLSSCSNENSETLSIKEPIIGVATYNNNVKSIMDNNCVSCHSAVPSYGAPMSLANYNDVKDATLNLGLINRMMLENGNGLLMPQGGPKLPQATIDIVVKWQQDGLKE